MRAIVHRDGRLRMGGLVWRAALGRGGARADKQEGDGATPVGILPLRRVLYRADRLRPPACAVPIEPLSPEDGWCDDPGHADYNRPIRLPHDGRHEALWREDAVYDVIGVLGWNDAPVRATSGLGDFPARRPARLRADRGLRGVGAARSAGGFAGRSDGGGSPIGFWTRRGGGATSRPCPTSSQFDARCFRSRTSPGCSPWQPHWRRAGPRSCPPEGPRARCAKPASPSSRSPITPDFRKSSRGG